MTKNERNEIAELRSEINAGFAMLAEALGGSTSADEESETPVRKSKKSKSRGRKTTAKGRKTTAKGKRKLSGRAKFLTERVDADDVPTFNLKVEPEVLDYTEKSWVIVTAEKPSKTVRRRMVQAGLTWNPTIGGWLAPKGKYDSEAITAMFHLDVEDIRK